MGLVNNPTQSSSVMKKSMKQIKGVNESFDRSPIPGGRHQQLDDNSMIMTGGAPIEPSIAFAETPAKKGTHYPSIN
jgi:hypothetical protein